MQLSLLHKVLNHNISNNNNNKQPSLNLTRTPFQTFLSLHHVFFRTEWRLWWLWQPYNSKEANLNDNSKATRDQIKLGSKEYRYISKDYDHSFKFRQLGFKGDLHRAEAHRARGQTGKARCPQACCRLRLGR